MQELCQWANIGPMSDYARTSIIVEYSENSDFSESLRKAYVNSPSAPVMVAVQRVKALSASNVTVELGTNTTIVAVVVYNRSSTVANYCKATVKSTDTASNTQRIPGSDFIKLVDVDPASDLVLRMATVDDYADVYVIATA